MQCNAYSCEPRANKSAAQSPTSSRGPEQFSFSSPPLFPFGHLVISAAQPAAPSAALTGMPLAPTHPAWIAGYFPACPVRPASPGCLPDSLPLGRQLASTLQEVRPGICRPLMLCKLMPKQAQPAATTSVRSLLTASRQLFKQLQTAWPHMRSGTVT